jgi:hypothetical protein
VIEQDHRFIKKRITASQGWNWPSKEPRCGSGEPMAASICFTRSAAPLDPVGAEAHILT